jgi:hypothetical protein
MFTKTQNPQFSSCYANGNIQFCHFSILGNSNNGTASSAYAKICPDFAYVLQEDDIAEIDKTKT